MEITKYTILITGGTNGCGYEFASQLLALGNTVINKFEIYAGLARVIKPMSRIAPAFF